MFENENSIETLKEVEKKIEIPTNLYETFNFKFEKGSKMLNNLKQWIFSCEIACLTVWSLICAEL